jgi:hypothetical protein
MQCVDELIDGVEGVLFGDLIQVGIACSGGGTCVAKEALNMPQAQALLKEMCCKAVPIMPNSA